MTETVLVTGGSGFVASWCIVDLLKRGYSVRTTVRSLGKEPTVRSVLGTVVDPGDRLAFFTADLLSDSGWDAAVSGCDYVLHVASPLGGAGSRDPNSLIGPARDGALRVLRAATKAGVKRIVMTSSVAAASPPLGGGGGDGVSDETVWTDPNDRNLDTYRLSKTLAERAAKVPTRALPDFVLRLLSIFDHDLKVVTPTLGQRRSFTSAKAQAALGWTPRPAVTSVLECAESLIATGAV